MEFHGSVALPQPKATTGFRNAARIHQSITARIEKKTLIWLAERTPAWIHSDHLTLLGFAAMFLAGASYACARWNRYSLLLVIFFLVLNWLGDSLDGTLARVRNRLRPRYGFYVDHMVDAFGALFLMGGLAISGYIHWQIALGMLIAFLMLSVEIYLSTYTLGRFQMSYWIFGPTEIRILLAIGNVKLFLEPSATIAGHKFLLFDIGGAIATVGMLLMCAISAVLHTRQLYCEERVTA
jgi:archaetidylinositol phosphate synthase